MKQRWKCWLSYSIPFLWLSCSPNHSCSHDQLIYCVYFVTISWMENPSHRASPWALISVERKTFAPVWDSMMRKYDYFYLVGLGKTAKYPKCLTGRIQDLEVLETRIDSLVGSQFWKKRKKDQLVSRNCTSLTCDCRFFDFLIFVEGFILNVLPRV